MGRFVRPPLLGVQAHSWRIRVPPEAIVLDLGEPPILVTFGRKELTQTSNEGAIVRERGPPLGWPQSKGRANAEVAGDGFLRGSPRVRFNPRDERLEQALVAFRTPDVQPSGSAVIKLPRQYCAELPISRVHFVIDERLLLS